MYFDSFSDLIAMGGHGFYVWLAYGVAVAGLLGLTAWLRRTRRQILRDVKQRIVRQQRATEDNSNQLGA